MAARNLTSVGEPGRSQRVVKRWTENLATRLTREEIDASAMRTAELSNDIERLEIEKKFSAKEFKEKIDKAKKEMRAAARVATSGSEDRDVTVEERYDLVEDEVLRVRTDNDQVIGRRKATDPERQESLEFGGPQ